MYIDIGDVDSALAFYLVFSDLALFSEISKMVATRSRAVIEFV